MRAQRVQKIQLFIPSIICSTIVIFGLRAGCVSALDLDQPVARARVIAKSLQQEFKLPGLSIAVGLDGKLVWAQGFGHADIEQGVPVTSSSRFRIGSISKTFTATALGALLEQGKVALDTPIRTYLPSLPAKEWPVTLRQLGGHLSGVRHYRGTEFFSAQAYESVSPALSVFVDEPLEFQPGTRYLYSTYGWTLISAIIEHVAGRPFLSVMAGTVFEPLGMKDTVAERMDRIISNRVRYYEHDAGGGLVNAPYVDNSNKWAGGGFLSTPKDLVRFGLAHLKHNFLSEQTVKVLWQPQKTIFGEQTNYGIGWETWTDPRGRRTVGHKGSSVGGRSVVLLWPGEMMVIAVTSNLTQDPGLLDLGFSLGEVFRPSYRSNPTAAPTNVPGTQRQF